jgi:hypothetical protein
MKLQDAIDGIQEHAEELGIALTAAQIRIVLYKVRLLHPQYYSEQRYQEACRIVSEYAKKQQAAKGGS